MPDPPPLPDPPKFQGAKVYPTPAAAKERKERRKLRLAIVDALHALRPQPSGPVIQRILSELAPNATMEQAIAKAKEYNL